MSKKTSWETIARQLRKEDKKLGPRLILCKRGHLERRLSEPGCSTCHMLYGGAANA